MMLSLGDGSLRPPTALPGECLGMVSSPTSSMVGSSVGVVPIAELLIELGFTKGTVTCWASAMATTWIATIKGLSKWLRLH